MEASSTVPLMVLLSTMGPFCCHPSSGQSDTSRSHRRSGPYSVSSANPLPFSAPIQTAYESQSEESGHALQLTEEEVEVFEAIKSRTILDFLHLARFGRFGINFFQSFFFNGYMCQSCPFFWHASDVY